MKENKGNNFESYGDIFEYSMRLNQLEDDEIFFLAISLDAEINDKKKYNIKNIITKLRSFTKEEFANSKKFLDDFLKSKGIVKEEEVSQNIPASDKLFFYFSPKVDLNTKAFYCIPIKTANIIYSFVVLCIISMIMIYRYITNSQNDMGQMNEKNFIFLILYLILLILGTYYLFNSSLNDNYTSAKNSLLIFEFKYIFLLLGNLLIEDKFENRHILNKFIGKEKNESLIIGLLPIIFVFIPIYLAYLQTSITRIKKKKLIYLK